MKSWHAIKQLFQLGLLAALTALGAACVGNPVGVKQPPLRASIVIGIVGGGGQVDTVARPLAQPAVAQATDSVTKATAPNVVVNWFRVSGKDTVFVGAALTDGKGQAKLQWTLLPQAGDQSVVAWVIDTTGRRSAYADVHATALPDQPDTVMLTAQTIVTWVGDKTVAKNLVGNVADQYGNITSGTATFANPADVSWGVLGGDTLVAYYEDQETTAVEVGRASTQLTITALRNLAQSAWRVGYSCIGRANDGQSEIVDTATLVGMVDSIHGSTPGAGYATWLSGQVQHHATQTGFNFTTSWVETAPFAAARTITAQAVGTIRWSTGEAATWGGTAYVGGELTSICADYLRTRGFQSATTLQQLQIQAK